MTDDKAIYWLRRAIADVPEDDSGGLKPEAVGLAIKAIEDLRAMCEAWQSEDANAGNAIANRVLGDQ